MKPDHQFRVLIIGSVWPEPGSSAAGSRMIQLIRLFREQNWDITFGSAAAESPFMTEPESLGVKKVNLKLNDASFDEFLKKLNPGLVLFDRFMTEEQFGWRVEDVCPDALRILDTEDLHGLRSARQRALKEGRACTERDLRANKTTLREIASVYRSDLSLIISEAEMEFLRKVFYVDESLLHYLPFLLKPEERTTAGWTDFHERQHFMTIGNFLHEPNRDAVSFLKKEIWPLIRKNLPEAEMHVYGAYHTVKKSVSSNPEEGFFIKGRVEDAGAVFKNVRVCLAPLRFGAGLKGKLLEAMRNGTPSVTTSIGAEGINEKNPWPGAIVDDPLEFAARAVKLYSDSAFWNESRKKIPPILENRFAAEKFKNPFINRIQYLKKELIQHRNRNFTGAMLRHHTAAGNRFMGKWIEEKNRNQSN